MVSTARSGVEGEPIGVSAGLDRAAERLADRSARCRRGIVAVVVGSDDLERGRNRIAPLRLIVEGSGEKGVGARAVAGGGEAERSGAADHGVVGAEQLVGPVPLAVAIGVGVETDADYRAARVRHAACCKRDGAAHRHRARRGREAVDRGQAGTAGHEAEGIGGVEAAAGHHFPLQRGQPIGALEDRVADLAHRGVGIDGPSQGGDAGHVRRGHARARVRGVLAAGNRAVDGHARRGQVDGTSHRSC